MLARLALRLSPLLWTFVVALPFVAAASFAQLEAPDIAACEPPISTCGPSISLDPSRPDIGPPDDCPVGYACTCVPSCPDCDDCAAQVCVSDPTRECRTACDCAPGLGCFDGQCIAGFAPVFCCDSGTCPAGQQCETRAGEMKFCPEPDPSCRDRQLKASKAIEWLVERTHDCRADADCAQVGTDTECVGTCGAWVNRDRIDHVRKYVSWIDRKICSDFFEDGCPRPTPACLYTVGRCVENRCQGVPIQPGPPPRPLDPLQDTAIDGGVQHLAPRN